MASFPQMLKYAGPRLVPFLKTSAIYFVLFDRGTEPIPLYAFIKCLPIYCLVFFVALHGIGFGREHKYSRAILCGLILSYVGDAFLCWQNHFLTGMVFFSLAHLSYTTAFGLKPLNLPLAGLFFCFLLAGNWYIWDGLQGLMSFAVPFYGLLLGIMVWRAACKAVTSNLSGSSLCAFFGAVAFALSDFFIAVDRFVKPLAHPELVIMLMYYGAQLGISLSVLGNISGKKIKK